MILLDTPTAGSLPGLLYNISYLGFRPQDLKYIVVSHAHTDHFGAVAALAYLTGAKTFLGAVDAKDMREHPERMEKMNLDLGYYNECFTPDMELEDGDVISLGNTQIRCVLTPGHTVGVMSHFWTLEDKGRVYHVGIYGGAGFVSLSRAALERNGQSISLQQDFLDSIDKVWNEPVDIMLGNHPFHNDIYFKRERFLAGEEDAFIDPGEWHRYLNELRTKFQDFLKKSPQEVEAMYARSQILDYYKAV